MKIFSNLTIFNSLARRKSLNSGLIRFNPGNIDKRSIIAIGVNGYNFDLLVTRLPDFPGKLPRDVVADKEQRPIAAADKDWIFAYLCSMEMNKAKGHLAMLGANVMWGLMSPVAKMVFTAGIVAPMIMVDFRVAGAALLFWITSLFLPHEHVPPKDILRLFGAGMLGVLFNQGCFILGVSLTSPADASLVTTTMPMWVMVLAWLILREPITLKKAGGIAAGAAGAIILIAGNGTAPAGSNPALGDIIVLLAQLCYALYLTLYRNFIRRYSLVTLMKWMFLSATVVALPASIGRLASTGWETVSSMEWAGIAYVVICGTFLAYICIMIGQKHLRPTLVGMYNYVQPIVATITAICLGLDTFTPLKGLAITLIFSGVWLVTISKARDNGQPGSESVSPDRENRTPEVSHPTSDPCG